MSDTEEETKETKPKAKKKDNPAMAVRGETALVGVPKPEAVDAGDYMVAASESLEDEDSYATDPTPGGLVLAEGETAEDAADPQGEPEWTSLATAGHWVKLKDTDTVVDAGAKPGSMAVVLKAPKTLVDPDDFSPDPHYVRAEDQPILVRTRDDRGITLQVEPDDFEVVQGVGG